VAQAVMLLTCFSQEVFISKLGRDTVCFNWIFVFFSVPPRKCRFCTWQFPSALVTVKYTRSRMHVRNSSDFKIILNSFKFFYWALEVAQSLSSIISVMWKKVNEFCLDSSLMLDSIQIENFLPLPLNICNHKWKNRPNNLIHLILYNI
jgi:hypothetical protein